jgi:phosphoribosylformylglycinamidine synthase subunit PurS
MKVGIRVLPKPEVLDTQGRAVETTLRRGGHSLTSCKVGKYIVVDFPHQDSAKALLEAKKMAEEVLCNALTEVFEAEVLR